MMGERQVDQAALFYAFSLERHVLLRAIDRFVDLDGVRTHVAPFYCLFGLALTLYFASQGAGRMTVPAVAGVLRMAVTVLAGWIAVEKLGYGLDGVFAAIAMGMAAYGGLMAGLLLIAPWRARAAPRQV